MKQKLMKVQTLLYTCYKIHVKPTVDLTIPSVSVAALFLVYFHHVM